MIRWSMFKNAEIADWLLRHYGFVASIGDNEYDKIPLYMKSAMFAHELKLLTDYGGMVYQPTMRLLDAVVVETEPLSYEQRLKLFRGQHALEELDRYPAAVAAKQLNGKVRDSMDESMFAGEVNYLPRSLKEIRTHKAEIFLSKPGLVLLAQSMMYMGGVFNMAPHIGCGAAGMLESFQARVSPVDLLPSPEHLYWKWDNE
jgi:hypothetical protein